MQGQAHTVFLDDQPDDGAVDGENERQIIVLTNNGIAEGQEAKGEQLALMIYGPDQDATEFLTRDHFEELVTNARRIMRWNS